MELQQLYGHLTVLVGVVGNISACHADARGSIPRRGVFLENHCGGARLLDLTILLPKSDTFSIFAVSSLRRGHANLLCIVPIFTDDAEAFRITS